MGRIEKYTFEYKEFIEYHLHSKEVRKCQSSTEKGKSFYGTSTIEEADEIAMCIKEWEEGKKMLEELRDSCPEMFTPRIEGLALQFQYDVAGCMVDVGRYLDGEPECMVDFIISDSDKDGKIVDIYYEFTNNCDINTKDMMSYGIAVLALVDDLESRGFSCNIYAVGTTYERGKSVDEITTITIKKAGEALNVEAIMYAFHPSFFRRHWFAFHERKPYCASGYGKSEIPTKYNNEDVMAYFNDNPKRSFLIPPVSTLGKRNSPIKYYEKIKEKVENQMEEIDNGKIPQPTDKFKL